MDKQHDEHVMAWGDHQIELDSENWEDNDVVEYQIEDGDFYAL